MSKKTNVKKLVIIAILAAIAYLIVAVVRIPAILWLNYEPKDVIITIGGFLLGPVAALIISAIVSLVEMVTVSGTGPIGALMNVLSTCSFACTAAIIYKKKHSLGGAILGLLCGSATMIVVMLLWNWLITPMYMGATREAVAGMLIPVFLPFNALKAGLNSALILCLYKPLTAALRRTHLLPAPEPGKKKIKFVIYILGGALLLVCLFFLFLMRMFF